MSKYAGLTLTKVFEITDRDFAEFNPLQMRQDECWGFYNKDEGVAAIVCRRSHAWIISLAAGRA